MEATYPAIDFIELVLVGGCLGAFGQAIREILRFVQMRHHPEFTFSLSRFITNLSLGFIAGSVGVIMLVKSAASTISKQNIFTLLLSGYVTSDIIERMISVLNYSRPYGGRLGKGTQLPDWSNTEGKELG